MASHETVRVVHPGITESLDTTPVKPAPQVVSQGLHAAVALFGFLAQGLGHDRFEIATQ